MPVDLETRRTLKSLVATLAFLWLGCAAYAALEQLAGLLTFRGFTVHALTRLNTLTLFYWLPWVLLGPCVVLLSQRLPIRPESWVVEAIGTERMPAVVFLTAYGEHAPEAFRVNAIDYL